MAKRIFDIAGSIIGLGLLSPILLWVAIAVKVTSRGPIIYQATRIGKGGKHFNLYKFRSMVDGAERLGPGITSSQDKRITPVGRWLRRTKLDELPQLFNVLKGDMSLVGPRPEDPRYVALYTTEQRHVLDVRPGITSQASIEYRNEQSVLVGDSWERKYIDQIMPAKLAIDLEYVRETNVFIDLVIILRTFARLFT